MKGVAAINKYIRQVLPVVAQKYGVTIITTTYVSEDTGRAAQVHKLRIYGKGSKKMIAEKSFGSERALVLELAEWAN